MSTRPEDERRKTYVSGHPREDFIIPLLHSEILDALGTFCTDRSPIKPKALDVGCGSQPFQEDIVAAGYHYFGLDVVQNKHGSVDYVAAVDGDLPPQLIENGPFDLLLCTEVLEHVADWDKAFENMRSLTRVSSKAIITCPHFYMLHEEPYDFWRPTTHALKYFSEKYGFKILRMHAAGDAWDVLGTLLGSTTAMAATSSRANRLYAKFVRRFIRLIHSAIRGKRLRSMIRLDGALYLSNVAVIERT